ncbi:leucine efflux protein LeuE [Polynucleobacter sp. VK25]|uniref:leucine efflux protein LeuE n=1 Tax=Polynucleobacter sp. VK25 TaxID=1758398 RepID=UPI001BFDD159|nr:leucine efflux protein LeuE [Polynucleobacter sp. VK25]QWD67714.1 leucine efflux protein LeuE [Polynucleobacter sp. VK25]
MEWLALDHLLPSNAGIVDFPTYLLGTIFTILLPGPNSLYVLTIAIQKGWRSGTWGAIGIFIGDSILMIAVALGAASLLLSSPMVFNVLRTSGAIYLLWMGFGLLRSGLKRWNQVLSVEVVGDLQARIMRLHPLAAALTLSLTNPKAIFFFIAFFSQFIRPDFERPLHTFFYLAIVLQIMSMTYLACLIAVGQVSLKFFQARPRCAAALWMLAGILFIGFAIRLLLI